MALLKIKDTDGTWQAQGNVGVFGSSGGSNTEILFFDISIDTTCAYKEIELGDTYKIKRVYGGGFIKGDSSSSASGALYIGNPSIGEYGMGITLRRYETLKNDLYISYDIPIANTNDKTTLDSLLYRMYGGVIGESSTNNVSSLGVQSVLKEAMINMSVPMNKIVLQYQNRRIQLNAGTHIYLWLEVEKEPT